MTSDAVCPDDRRAVGLGQLTMLDVSPPELVTAAAAAGFDFVGLRVSVGGPSERPWPLAPGSALLRETQRRLDDTGLFVQETDVLVIRPETTRQSALPALEITAALGATLMITMVADDEPDRVEATLGALAPLAAEHGVRLVLEPMSYQAVRTIAQALRVIEAVPGLGLMIDPLHLFRSGDGLGALRGLDRTLVPSMQLCDAPLRLPDRLPNVGRLPRGQAVGTNLGQLEARAWRLPVGEGELPLAELVSDWPTIPISVEAPHLGLRRRLDPTALARHHHTRLVRLLDDVRPEALNAG